MRGSFLPGRYVPADRRRGVDEALARASGPHERRRRAPRRAEGAVADHGGVLVKSKGKGTQRSRSSPVLRTRWLLRRRSSALGAEPWPDGIDIRARAALHTGEGELRDCDYYGATINRCVRMRTVAHGGQTICSQATADRLADGLPAEVGLKASARIACATSSGPSRSSRSPARSSRRSSRSSHRSDWFDRGIAGNAR